MVFEFLKNPENRKELAQYIQDNVPELLECDPNNHVHNMVDILELDTYHEGHHFRLVLRSSKIDFTSYQHLYSISADNTNLEDVEKKSKINEWGFKMNEGWKYPNLGIKFKNIILQYFRNKKLTILTEMDNSAMPLKKDRTVGAGLKRPNV